MIGIVDYGIGNVEAFRVAYKRLNVASKRLQKKEDVEDVSHIILPGVGSFDIAVNRFKKSDVYQSVISTAQSGKPVLGVCVGMQMLADSSTEGKEKGLSLISGDVRKFSGGSHRSRPLRCPHMGWNDITVQKDTGLFDGLDNERFYFLHSYWFHSADMDEVVATAYYGNQFPCSVMRKNIMGVQFHPEKSHSAGLRLLDNFRKI